jgi:D-tyrosyl-tRNA(Tyr) deacylase
MPRFSEYDCIYLISIRIINMRAVVQRVTKASVSINKTTRARIGSGLLILAGIEDSDDINDVEWLAGKIARLRIFDDDNGIMNLSVTDVGGDLLVVSQFTLHAKTKKGNRPSYIKAASPEKAIPLYNAFNETLSTLTGKTVLTGEFGAMMQVELNNDGPVTIIIDTKEKE